MIYITGRKLESLVPMCTIEFMNFHFSFFFHRVLATTIEPFLVYLADVQAFTDYGNFYESV